MDRASLVWASVFAALVVMTVSSEGQTVGLLNFTQTNCPNNGVLVKLAACDPALSVEQLTNYTEELTEVLNSNDTDAIQDFIRRLPEIAGASSLEISKVAEGCKNMTRQEKILRCSSRVMRACTDMDKADNVPDEDAVVAGLHYLCQHLAGLDLKCVQENVLGISNCASQQTIRYIDSLPRNSTVKDLSHEIQCSGFRFQLQCSRHILILCDGDTGTVYSNYMAFMFPSKCHLPLPHVATPSNPQSSIVG